MFIVFSVKPRMPFLPSGEGGGSSQSIWESAVTIIGIAVCVVVILVTVGCVVQHHVAKKRRRAKLAQTPVHQALLGCGGDMTNGVHGGPAGGTGLGGGSSLEGSANVSFAETAIDQKKQTRVVDSAYGPSSSYAPHRPLAVEAHTTGSVHSIPSPYLAAKSMQFRTPDSLRRMEAGGRTSGQSSPSSRHLEGKRPSRLSTDKTNPLPKKMLGPPMVFEEDLSPTATHTGPALGHAHSSHAHTTGSNKSKNKQKSGGYKKKEYDDDIYVLEKRPPVEGRDSLTRDKLHDDDVANLRTADFVPPTKAQRAEIRDLRPMSEANRPYLKALDLHRGQERPEERHQATSPLSNGSTDMSPDIDRSALFAVDDSISRDSPCDFISNDDFEYDDYVPQLPGSYFNMDPHAYTLTWSQHPPSAPSKGGGGGGLSASRADSEASVNHELYPTANSNELDF